MIEFNPGTFIIIPNRDILKKLSPYEKSIYFAVCAHADENGCCYPSRRSLADWAGTSIKTVDRSVRKLEEIGLIEVKSRSDQLGQTSNIYQILQVPLERGVTNDTGGRHKRHGGGVTNDTRTITNELYNLENTNVFSKYSANKKKSNPSNDQMVKGDERSESKPFSAPYDTPAGPPPKRFSRPTIEEVTAYCEERKNGIDPEAWYSHYESNGWKVGRNPMKNWKAAVVTWERSREARNPKPKEPEWKMRPGETMEEHAARMLKYTQEN